MSAVREVESENVHSRLDHFPDHRGFPRRGAKRRHDLGADLAERFKDQFVMDPTTKPSVPPRPAVPPLGQSSLAALF